VKCEFGDKVIELNKKVFNVQNDKVDPFSKCYPQGGIQKLRRQDEVGRWSAVCLR